MSFPWESIKADESRNGFICYCIVFRIPDILYHGGEYAKKHYLT